MTDEQKKKVVRQFLQGVWIDGDLGVVDNLVAPDFLGHSPGAGEPIEGPETLSQFISGYRGIFPDLTIRVDRQIADGDMVLTQWTERGTHLGESPHFPPPTGRTMEVTGMVLTRIVNGRIKESWSEWNMLDQLRQLGILDEQEANAN